MVFRLRYRKTSWLMVLMRRNLVLTLIVVSVRVTMCNSTVCGLCVNVPVLTCNSL